MKRLLMVSLVALLMLLVVSVFLEPTGVVLGWMNGETFYLNRPTRYWRTALTSSDPVVQARTHQELKEGGRSAVSVLAEVLQTAENGEARWKAADLLGQVGPSVRESPAAQAALTKVLQDDSSHVRAVAAAAIASIGPIGHDAIPRLQEMLDTENRLPALRALVRFGPEAAPAMPQLMVLLQNDDESEVRWNAARTLGKIGPAAEPTTPILVEALQDHAVLVREHAAEALGDIGPEAKEAIPALVKVLKDPDARVRRDAVRSLGQMGSAAKSAVESIRPLLQDKEERVRKSARTSLQQIELPQQSEPRP